MLRAMASSRRKVRPATTACARTEAQGCTVSGRKRCTQPVARGCGAQRECGAARGCGAARACIIELATVRSWEPMPLAKTWGTKR